jgi:hypothetical protein
MFLATRIVNGIIAVLALLMGTMLYFDGGLVMRLVAYQFLLVFALFVADLLFRKKNLFSDIVFSTIWSIVFSFYFVVMAMRFSLDIPEEIGGPILYCVLVALMCGVPLILNATHLFQNLPPQKSEVR